MPSVLIEWSRLASCAFKADVIEDLSCDVNDPSPKCYECDDDDATNKCEDGWLCDSCHAERQGESGGESEVGDIEGV